MTRYLFVLLMTLAVSLCRGEVLHILDITDVTILGAERDDYIGFHMADLGDINADGYADVFLSRSLGEYDPGEPTAYIVLGGTDIPEEIDLADPPGGIVTVRETVESVRASGIGDFNWDGLDDFVISDDLASPNGIFEAGEVLILFGDRLFPQNINYPDPALRSVRLLGSRQIGLLGFERSAAGDVNGDGFMDLLLGARGSTFGNRITEAFIIYGGTDLPAELSTDELGDHGVRMESAVWEDGFGEEVAGVGDVNGDGFDDVLVSASNRFEDAPDKTYLIYGGTDVPGDFSVADLGERGVVFGPVTGEWFGRVLGAAGDVNGDGLADFLIASQLADPQGVTNAGEVYLIFGAKDFPRQIFRDQFLQYGMVMCGGEPEDRLAGFVSGPGRIGEGIFPAPLIGSMYLSGHEVQILKGGRQLQQIGRTVAYDTLERLELLIGIGSALYVGDVNGGGRQDLLCGMPPRSPLERQLAGEVRIVYGERLAGRPTSADLDNNGLVDYLDLFLFSEQWYQERESDPR